MITRTLAWLLLGLGATSCLPADTRPPAGSIFLAVVPADEPSMMTADGWSISIDRLLLGIGDASLQDGCTRYSEARYGRILDARLPGEQKVSVLFGLGHCFFDFAVASPAPDALLGEGVTEADKELMGSRERGPSPAMYGIAVDFAATATRDAESKHVRWMLRLGKTFTCGLALENATKQPFALQSDENLTLHIGVRGAALFGDGADTATAMPRFDAIAAADTIYGDGDGEVTLDELGHVTLEEARRFGPYGLGSDTATVPGSLEDYLYLVLFSHLIELREDVDCIPHVGGRSD